jgi:branched-subunit amino acid ABC-type transport system permease component
LAPLLLVGELLAILLAALLFAGGLNIVIEQLAFRPFRRRSQLAPLIATMGLSFILYQVALLWRYFLPNWRPGEHRSVPGVPELPRDSIPDLLPSTNLLHWLGVKSEIVVTPKDLLVIGLACLGAWSIYWFLQRTTLGKAMRACAESPEQAQLCGIDPQRIFRITFGVGGLFAGFAAFVFALYYTHPGGGLQ